MGLHPNGDRILTGGEDKTIKFWKPLSGQEMFSLSAHQGTITDLAFSPDGRWLGSVGADGKLKVWSGEKGEFDIGP